MNDMKIPYAEYSQLAMQFNPTNFNPDAWAQLAHDAGMGYFFLFEFFSLALSGLSMPGILHLGFGVRSVRMISSMSGYGAVAASILALYVICGFPYPDQPDPFSYDKFENAITHQRKITGTMVDTRSMYLWQPDYKRQNTVDLLALWVDPNRRAFTVLEGLELLGVLTDASRWYRWGRIHTFILQNVMRRVMRARYAMLVNTRNVDMKKMERRLNEQRLHPSVVKKLTIAGCNEQWARFLYYHKDTTDIVPRLRQELVILYDYLRDFTNPWRINIGHMIDRDNVATNVGDSSFYGLGFFSDEQEGNENTCSDNRSLFRLNMAHLFS